VPMKDVVASRHIDKVLMLFFIILFIKYISFIVII